MRVGTDWATREHASLVHCSVVGTLLSTVRPASNPPILSLCLSCLRRVLGGNGCESGPLGVLFGECVRLFLVLPPPSSPPEKGSFVVDRCSAGVGEGRHEAFVRCDSISSRTYARYNPRKHIAS